MRWARTQPPSRSSRLEKASACPGFSGAKLFYFPLCIGKVHIERNRVAVDQERNGVFKVRQFEEEFARMVGARHDGQPLVDQRLAADSCYVDRRSPTGLRPDQVHRPTLRRSLTRHR